MIYTVTFNPSLDYKTECNDFSIGKTNRSIRESVTLGGKGVNVSKALMSLGADNASVLFVGSGEIGSIIEKRMSEELAFPIAVKTRGDNRINTKVICSGTVTEINARGSLDISEESLIEALELMKIKGGDIVVVSGNTVKSGVLTDFCKKLLETCQDIKLILDVAESEMKDIIELYGDNIILIKPNRDEFCKVFGSFDGLDAKLRNINTQAVAVTDGSGAVYYRGDSGDVYRVFPPKVTAVDTVGAGDSFIAGYLYAICNGIEGVEAVKVAVAVSSCKVSRYGFSSLRNSLESCYIVKTERAD